MGILRRFWDGWNELFGGFADIPPKPITPTRDADSDFGFGKSTGMSICAATVDHILDGCPDDASKAELILKLQKITERWAEYNAEAYTSQRERLKTL